MSQWSFDSNEGLKRAAFPGSVLRIHKSGACSHHLYLHPVPSPSKTRVWPLLPGQLTRQYCVLGEKHSLGVRRGRFSFLSAVAERNSHEHASQLTGNSRSLNSERRSHPLCISCEPSSKFSPQWSHILTPLPKPSPV